MLLLGASAGAQSLDSAELRMTGFIEDVCSVEAVAAVTAQDVEDFTHSPIGAGVKLVQASFRAAIDNDSRPGDADIGLPRAGRVDVGMDLYCNDVFQFTVEAANGALVTDRALTNGGDFTDRLPYEIEFRFPDGASTPRTAAGGAPGVIVRNLATPAQDGLALLTVHLGGTAKPPIAGLYQEALTVSFVQDGVTPPATLSP